MNSLKIVMVHRNYLMKKKCGLPHYVCRQNKKTGMNKQGLELVFFKRMIKKSFTFILK